MKMLHLVKLSVILIIFSVTLVACQSINSKQVTKNKSTEPNLRQFAYANCFFWYFKKMGYDTKDIRSITGGIVEIGFSSPDKYQKLALFIKDYKPDIKTKHQVDIDLLKCFSLDKSTELNELINSLQ